MKMETASETNRTIQNYGSIPIHRFENCKKENIAGMRCISWFGRCLEIPLFIFFFAFAISGNVCNNLILLKTCTISLGYNETICKEVLTGHLDNATKELEDIMQERASKIILYMSLANGIFPAIISLFLGPWSDKNGRKPLIISSLFGYFVNLVMLIGYLHFDNLDPMYLILSVIPFSISGGYSSLITGSFCYASDISDSRNRSYRMALLEGSFQCGILLGSICSSYAFQLMDYIGVFVMCSILMLLAIVYSLYILEESVKQIDGTYSHFLDFQLIKALLTTCFKSRPNRQRLNIWLCLLACSFGIFVMQGDATVLYLFTRETLNWNIKTYTIYSAFSIVTSVIGIGIVTVVLQKCFKLGDHIIAMIAYFWNTVRSVLITHVYRSWHMYVCEAISAIRGVSRPFTQAILSNLVPPDEVGKALALTTSFETMIPLISGPLYVLVYKNTIIHFPGAFNIISAALYGTCFILMGFIEYNTQKYPALDHSLMENADH